MHGYLTEDEHASWRAWVTASRKLNDLLGRTLQDGQGISMADFEILGRLAEADSNSMRMKELAQQMVCSRSRLSHQIDRLERAGLVARQHCPTDGRGLYAVLTARGEKAYRAAAPDHADGIRANFFGTLSRRDIEAITKACVKLTATIDHTPA